MPANREDRNPVEAVSSEMFLTGTELAKSYGRLKQMQAASRNSSYLTTRHLVICDSTGKEIVRFPRSLVESSNAIVDQPKAVAWARSMGYPVPEEPNGCLNGILIAIGLLIFIVPGVMIMIWVAYNWHDYQREMNALVARWVEAGKPEPGISTNLDAMLKTSSALPIKKRLLEYKEMLDNELISQDEYEALRKKALDL